MPSGRIDAANALAECVVIGDPSTLRETAGPPRAMPDGKFVVPTIPAVGAPRPKSPSTAPDPQASKPPPVERAKPATVPPDPAATKLPAPATMPKPPVSSRMTSIGFPIVDKVPAKSEPIVSNATTLGMPALERKPDPALASTKIGTEAPLNPTPPFIPAQSPPASKPASPHDEPTTISAAEPTAAAKPLEAGEDDATTIGAPPVKKPAAPAVPVAAPVDESASKRTESAKHQKATSIGFPALRTPFETQPLTLVPSGNPFKADGTYDPQPPTLPKSPRSAAAPTPRGKTPTTPPLTPRHPTPVAPVPIVRPPAKAAPHAAEDEATELSSELVATAPTEPMPSVDSGAVPKPAQRSGGMRASEILAAIPAGDWTMTPDESMPHALPAEAKLPAMPDQEPTPTPSPVPSGDWTISLDPQTGWSAPAKVAPPEVGNPVHAVASDKPINVVQWDEKPTGIGESKIEIDSSLMDTQRRAPSSDDEPARIIDTKPADVPPPLGRYAPPTTPPSYPMRQSSTDLVGYGAAQSASASNKKKMIALAIIAVAVAAGAIVMLVLTLGGAKQTSQAATPTPNAGSAAPAVAPAPPPVEPAPEAPPAETGSAQVAVAVPAGSASETKPAEVEAPAPEVEAPKPAPACKVDIKSVPAGADIYVEQQKLGTAPKTIELPCGTETKLTLKKKSFPTTPRLVTPVAGKANKLVIKLAKTLFSVKVTSTPAGATITTGKKSVGVTPTTIKLPAYEASSITLKKPGFAPDTQRVNPKRNNTSHHVTLKKGR
jgi:hypothetical protein